MSKLRHLSYANVVSTLALIAAIGGGTTAIAVKKKAPKGKVVRVTKASDITRKGTIRPDRVTREKIAALAVGPNELGPIGVRQLNGTGTVTCGPGERLLSGGVGGGGAAITNSRPEPTAAGLGWTGSSGGNTVVYAICLAP